MKVVQINAVYEFSSTGRTTREMHVFLQSEGIESYVFCANKNNPHQNIFKMGNTIDHFIHGLCSRVIGLQGYFSYFATSRMLSKLKEIKPNVVILRNLHANYVNIPMTLRFLARHQIPTIVVLHDCYLFTGHCCYYTKDHCDKWMSECHSCPILDKYNKSLFFDWSRKIFRDKKKLFGAINKLAVIGVSDWVANEAKLSPVFAKAKYIERIYNWIDHSVFYPREGSDCRKRYGLGNEDFVILGVAQVWDDVKGLPLFIQLAEKMPDVKILLAGAIGQVVLPPNIIPAGIVSSTDELATLYSMANVLVNFSIQETFGKVAAEALSCGTPIIVNRSTANPELCGDGCGKIVNNRTCSEVIQQVKTIKEEGKSNYSIRCQQFANNNFSKDKNLRAYLDLFKRL